MLRMVVLADDMTGSVDTAVQFASRGIPTHVCRIGALSLALARPFPVITVDMDIRHKRADEARKVVLDACAQARGAGIDLAYLKVDSALRGNIGASLEAAVLGWGSRVYFAPAYPEMGRTTLHGLQYVDGVPVSHSTYGRDLRNPVQLDHVADLITAQSDIPVTTVPDPEQRGVVLMDAMTQTDMMRNARIALADAECSLYAGCAGFAACLADLLPFQHGRRKEYPHGLGLLVLCGSVSDTALEQIAAFERAGARTMLYDTVLREEPEAFARRHRPSAPHESLQITTALTREGVERLTAEGASLGLSVEQSGKRIARRLGELAALLIGEHPEHVPFLIGGDTLLSTLRAMNVEELTPVCEYYSGVALSQLPSVPCGWLFSKSGGFGKADLLVEMRRMVTQTAMETKEVNA